MVGMTEIVAAIGAVKGSIETLKAGSDLYQSFKAKEEEASNEELRHLAQRLAEDLFKARLTSLEVQTQLLELQAAVKAEDDFAEKLSLYHLAKTEAGGEIWQLANEEEDGKHFHSAVCPTCVVKSKELYPLQRTKNAYHCAHCGTAISNMTFRPPKKELRVNSRRR